MSRFDRLPLTSLSPNEDRTEALKSLFPEAFTEDKIDFERLKQALGATVQTDRERYGLSWAGKSDAIHTLQSLSVGTLEPQREQSVNFDTTENLIIEGDNLEVLKLLQKSYFGKVKMIYIDPPYNTGNEFIYPDNFREGLEEYLRYSGQVSAEGVATSSNKDTDGRYHSKWLSMMYPRLFLARNLLREDGVIFVSIDDNEVHNLRLLMNDIFGEENFIGLIAVQLNPRGRHLDRFLAKTHEYMMVYARSANENSFEQLAKDERMQAEYGKHDTRGKYRELELRNRNPAFNRKTRPNLFYPFYVNPADGDVSLVPDASHSVEVLPKNSRGDDSCWTWGTDKSTKDKAILVARSVADGGWRIFRKDYLVSEDGQQATTKPKALWLDKEINNDYGKKALQDLFDETLFDFPKATALIGRAVQLGTGLEDTVLDFFAGSGTTAQAVMELNAEDGGNRKFILTQLPEPTQNKQFPTIADITRERVRRVIAKMDDAEGSKLDLSDGLPSDRGFKALRLTSSNFKVWEDALGNLTDADAIGRQLELFADNLQPDALPENILFEILLKAGYDLNVSREEIAVAEQHAYAIGGGSLIVCLERGISRATLDAILARDPKPQTVICLDEAFHGDDALLTNALLQMQDAGITFQTI